MQIGIYTHVVANPLIYIVSSRSPVLSVIYTQNYYSEPWKLAVTFM